MKKLWSVILLIGLVNAQMPQPTLVGQDELQIPTLSINNFVNQAEIEGLEDTRVFLGITNILNSAFKYFSTVLSPSILVFHVSF